MAGRELWPEQPVGRSKRGGGLFEVQAQSAGTGPRQRWRSGKTRTARRDEHPPPPPSVVPEGPAGKFASWGFCCELFLADRIRGSSGVGENRVPGVCCFVRKCMTDFHRDSPSNGTTSGSVCCDLCCLNFWIYLDFMATNADRQREDLATSDARPIVTTDAIVEGIKRVVYVGLECGTYGAVGLTDCDSHKRSHLCFYQRLKFEFSRQQFNQRSVPSSHHNFPQMAHQKRFIERKYRQELKEMRRERERQEMETDEVDECRK
ncbi:Ribonuclease 3 [Solea senegalensis]|uniref:Ribonuclease 3 n=1 Tax=Solea senegalensis TaxID=28829 RepID=A0AAV6T4K8_SOLSE|nr:Ribonuclease 3 [Solea senegalensis]